MILFNTCDSLKWEIDFKIFLNERELRGNWKDYSKFSVLKREKKSKSILIKRVEMKQCVKCLTVSIVLFQSFSELIFFRKKFLTRKWWIDLFFKWVNALHLKFVMKFGKSCFFSKIVKKLKKGYLKFASPSGSTWYETSIIFRWMLSKRKGFVMCEKWTGLFFISTFGSNLFSHPSP